MRIVIGAIGRLKAGPEPDLFKRYQQRFDQLGRGVGLGPLDLIEIPEARGQSTQLRQSQEGQQLLDRTGRCERRLVLDERGQQMTSAKFCQYLADARDDGVGSMAIIIGGADGHGPAVREAADLVLAVGSWTLPHGLVRIVLVEQLYRAATLLAGHPLSSRLELRALNRDSFCARWRADLTGEVRSA